MGTNIESKLEAGWKAVISDESYIKAVGTLTPVYSYHDCSHIRPQKCVVVKVNPVENEYSSSGVPGSLYKCTVELTAITFTPDDKDRAILNAIYQAVLGVAKGTTKVVLNTAIGSGLTCYGWTINQGDEGTEDNIQFITVKLECHVGL